MNNLVDQLKRDEGFRENPYADEYGNLTVGYGHNLDANPVVLEYPLSEARATLLLEQDVMNALSDLAGAGYGEPLAEPERTRFMALANMTFNMGIKKFLKFSETLAAWRAGDFEACAAGMLDSLWARQLPERSRRLAEQMRTGEWS